MALVALVTEAEIDVLTVTAEPVTNSLGVSGVDNFTASSLFLKGLNLFFCDLLGDFRHDKLADFFDRLIRYHVFRSERRNKIGRVEAHRSGSTDLSLRGKCLAIVSRVERSAFEALSETISTRWLSVHLSRNLQVLG